MADWFTSFTEDEAKNDASKNDTVEKKEPSTSGGEDNWFDKFESTSAEKGEGEGEGNDDEEDSSWIDMPLEWMTGRKSRGLSLEMYDHEHHLFELAHEGVVVISEEGIHAAYEHLTHDALLAIAKAHIRFGIVEVHDYDENDPRPFSMANKSNSGRKIQRSSYNLLEDDRKPEDFVKRKKKRMTTAEINDEAEKLVQQWEKNGAGDSGDSSHSSSIPGWFYGHIERLGFVPASKLVKEPKNDKKHFKRGIHAGIEEEDEDFDDDGEEKDGEGDQGHSFEKGHSVSLVDPTHEKIPQGTEGTILMLLKDSGKIMVNFPGYGVAPFEAEQLTKSQGKADGEVLETFLQGAAADVDNIGKDDDDDDDDWTKNANNNMSGGGGAPKKAKGFWKWLKGMKGSDSSNDPRRLNKKKKKGSFVASFFKSRSSSYDSGGDSSKTRSNSFFSSPFSSPSKSDQDIENDPNRLTVGGKDDFNLDDDPSQTRQDESKQEEEEEDFEAIRRKREAEREKDLQKEEEKNINKNQGNEASSSSSSSSSPSTSSSSPGVGEDDMPTRKEDLPYGGVLQEAMKAQDRTAIRTIMNFNKMVAANGGIVPTPTTTATSHQKQGEDGDGSGGGAKDKTRKSGRKTSRKTGTPGRKSGRKTKHYHHHHHHHKGELKKPSFREGSLTEQQRQQLLQQQQQQQKQQSFRESADSIPGTGQSFRESSEYNGESFREDGQSYSTFSSLPGFQMPDAAKRLTMGLMDFLGTINPTEDEYYSESCSSSSSGSESETDSDDTVH